MAGVLGELRLHADVEEPDSVLQLLPWTHCLAADGGCGHMAGRGVVGSGDGERGQQDVVFEFAHPGVEIGGGVDGEVGFGRNEDAGELESGIVA